MAENFINGYAIRSENQNITEDFRGIYRQLVEYDNNTDWNEGISKDY